MVMSLRPRRSVLYMPGSNQRALEKAKTLPADVLVLDLEDAVAPEQKEAAREQVLAAVQAGGYGKRELVIRANGLSTPWGREDVLAIARAPVSAVCMPKVESAAEVRAVSALLKEAGAPAQMEIWAMIETPRGVVNVQEIAAADVRLSLLLMGTSDLAKDMRIPHTADRLGFISALSQCVLAARANQLDILDGVHLALDDESGLLAICEQGRNLGFDGKSLIHPKQIAAANAVFSPAEADVVRARKIIDAWRETEAAGEAVVVVDGKLVEVLHVEEAHRTLAIWDAIAERQ
ncbi:CoA ester lyase [Pseudomaricurvus alcaniphilus]|nr:CoA ester lyase [Pseudomaricurvus alcaniphilus]